MKSFFAGLVSILMILAICGNSNSETFEKISESGFGNDKNRYAWSMCEFTPSAGDSKGIKFLYVGTNSDSSKNGCEIHRMKPGTEDEMWEPVMTDGFGIKHNKGIRMMIVYENQYGKALYAGVLNRKKGCHIYRTFDGLNWELINFPNFGTRAHKSCASTRSAAVINGALYVGTVNDSRFSTENPYLFRFIEKRTMEIDGEIDIEASWEAVIKPSDEISSYGRMAFSSMLLYTDKNNIQHICAFTWNALKGAHLLTSETGDSGTWKIVMDNGFKKHVTGVFNTVEHNGYLYAGTGDMDYGFNLFRSNDPANPDSWEQIGEDAFGTGKYNKYLWTLLKASDNTLYLGTCLFPAFAPSAKKGAFLYKSSDGLAWTQIVGDVSDTGPGFGDPENFGIRVGIEVENTIYFGTAISPLFPFGSHGCEIWKLIK